MTSKVGVARLGCSACTCISYVPVHSLLQSATTACLYCHEVITVADVEVKDPDLSRILTILRQLAEARTAHRQRGENVLA